jgi:hypothetical protein
VTDPHDNQLPGPGPATTPPPTGHPAVDDALGDLADLASAPLEQHHDRLARAHEALQDALDRGDDDRSDDGQSS